MEILRWVLWDRHQVSTDLVESQAPLRILERQVKHQTFKRLPTSTVVPHRRREAKVMPNGEAVGSQKV